MDVSLPDCLLLVFRFCFVVCLQLSKMGDEFLFACQAHEVVANHLERPFCWLTAGPDVDQEACDDGTVTLNFDSILAMTDEMRTAKARIKGEGGN